MLCEINSQCKTIGVKQEGTNREYKLQVYARFLEVDYGILLLSVNIGLDESDITWSQPCRLQLAPSAN